MKCIFCGGVSEYLCDFKIGYNREINPIYKRSDQAFTCDAPLCKSCRVVRSEIRLKSHVFGIYEESIDWCCKGHSEQPKRLKGITAEEAREIRAEYLKKCREIYEMENAK